MRVLGDSTQRLVASPALLQAHGLSAPLLPADLGHLPSLDEGPPHRGVLPAVRDLIEFLALEFAAPALAGHGDE